MSDDNLMSVGLTQSKRNAFSQSLTDEHTIDFEKNESHVSEKLIRTTNEMRFTENEGND